MKFYSNLLCGALCAAIVSPAVANVATTAGSNLTAYNGTGAMNNNQWNSLMNGRAGMAQNAAEANFGNCNAVVLRCATPKCANGGCIDANVASGIVTGCVNTNESCKQYGNDLIQYITAQVMAQSTAKVQQQQNAVEIAKAQAEASAAAAEQNNAQMQQQMTESMTAMQEQMAANAESQNAQIQTALEKQNTNAATAPTSTGNTGTVIAGMEGLGVAEQIAAANGISTDILVREQMGGKIETAVEDAMVQMKSLKNTLDSIIKYAECDSGVTDCKGPKRVKKFKELANEFFDPYEQVLDNMYDALVLAMTLGIDVSDVIMLLTDSCNIWGKYLCDTCDSSKAGDHPDEGVCSCNNGTNDCYWRVRTTSGRVAQSQPHCRLVDTIASNEKVWHEWIDANSGITGTTQVACASDMIDTMSIFKGRRKKATIDIDELRDFINQDSYGTCKTPIGGNFNVLEDCGARFCNVDPKTDAQRIKQLRDAVNTRKVPTTDWCFKTENAMKNFDNGGSFNNEATVGSITQKVTPTDCEWLTDDECKVSTGCVLINGLCTDKNNYVNNTNDPDCEWLTDDECKVSTNCVLINGLCTDKNNYVNNTNDPTRCMDYNEQECVNNICLYVS